MFSMETNISNPERAKGLVSQDIKIISIFTPEDLPLL